jgi:hypothetical protein
MVLRRRCDFLLSHGALAITVTDQNEATAMPVNLIVGNDGSNSLQGTAGADLLYGFDPLPMPWQTWTSRGQASCFASS